MKVLFATDGSVPAKEGERLIADLFDRSVDVHVFSAGREPSYWFGMDSELELDRLDLPVLGGEQVASEAAERLMAEGFVASSRGRRGIPGPEILEEVKDQGADMIVVGASHSTWMGNVLLGSVSTYVVHHAPCSVLVVHRAPTGSGKVLFGTDGSEHARKALEVATSVLDSSRCSFEVAHAVLDPWLTVMVYPPGPPFGSYPQYREAEKAHVDHGWQVVERVCEELRGAGFKAEGAVLKGSAAHQLLEQADNVVADLVVAGARGLGPVRRTFMGSVSDQLIRHAPATLVGRHD